MITVRESLILPLALLSIACSQRRPSVDRVVQVPAAANRLESSDSPFPLRFSNLDVVYERYAVSSLGFEGFDEQPDTIVTMYEFPVVSGYADTLFQERVNAFCRILDTTGLRQDTSVISIRHLEPSEPDLGGYSESFFIALLSDRLLTRHHYYYLPGGARPMSGSSILTVSLIDFKPCSLASLFLAGYKRTLQDYIISHVPLDSTSQLDCRKPLQLSWIEEIEKLNDGTDIAFTDTSAIMLRNAEYDFGCSHAFGGPISISIPYGAILMTIRRDGPLYSVAIK